MINTVYEENNNEQPQNNGGTNKKRGRGPAKHVRETMFIGPKPNESPIGTDIIYFSYDPKPHKKFYNGKQLKPRKLLMTPDEVEQAFATIVSYCEMHGVIAHRRTFGSKVIYYVRIYADTLIIKRVIAQVTRAGLVGGKPNPQLAEIPPDLIFPS